MLAILAISFPCFALVLCGYLAVLSDMMPQFAIPGRNSFVLYFARPCLTVLVLVACLPSASAPTPGRSPVSS
jgi:predicted permease